MIKKGLVFFAIVLMFFVRLVFAEAKMTWENFLD